MPLMMANDQIAKEVRPVILAVDGIHLVPTKPELFMGIRERLTVLPPSILRPFFARVKISLRVPEDLQDPGLAQAWRGGWESNHDNSE